MENVEQQQKKALASHVANVIAELDAQKQKLAQMLADLDVQPPARFTAKPDTEEHRAELEPVDAPRSTIRRLIEAEKESSNMRIKTCEESLNLLKAKMQQLREDDTVTVTKADAKLNVESETSHVLYPVKEEDVGNRKDIVEQKQEMDPFQLAGDQSGEVFKAMGGEVFDDVSTEANLQLLHRRVISDNPPSPSRQIANMRNRPCSSVKDGSLLRSEKKQLRISSLQMKSDAAEKPNKRTSTATKSKKEIHTERARESACDICRIV
jgi:hypothetical protein